jgi:hypothetical protein
VLSVDRAGRAFRRKDLPDGDAGSLRLVFDHMLAVARPVDFAARDRFANAPAMSAVVKYDAEPIMF